MRILLLNDYAHGGGAEIVAQAEAVALRDRGHDARLLAADAEGLRRTPLSYIDSAPARRRLRAELAAFDPDVVHVHNLYHLWSPGILATLAAWKRGPRRVVLTAHDFHAVCPDPTLRRFTRAGPEPVDPARLRRPIWLASQRWDRRGRAWSALRVAQRLWNYTLLRRLDVIDAVIAPSRWSLSILAGAGLRVIHLPNPAPAPRVGPRPPRTPGPLRLIFVGRVEPEKGLEPFIAALAGVTDVHLTVVGDGSRLGACRNAAARAELPVDLPGRLGHARALDAIAAADALVLPAVGPENAPLVLFEALAASTPVLVSDAGGMREVLEDFGVGVAFNPHQPEDIRRAVADLRRRDPGDWDWPAVHARLADRSADRHAAALERLYADAACAS